MPNLNYTDIYFSIAPRAYGGSLTLDSGANIATVFGAASDSMVETQLKSVNEPLNIQVLWEDTGLGQDQEGTGASGERVAGDLVNVLFDIYEGTSQVNGSLNLANDFRKICTVKKSRDVPYQYQGRPSDEIVLTGHRFTINIAPILADLLSYNLVPPMMGTWGSNAVPGTTGPQGAGTSIANIYGGMNGQWQMNYVASTTQSKNEFNLEANGADRRVTIRARFEILAADGTLVESTSPSSRTAPDFSISNSAPQLGDISLKNHSINRYGAGARNFLTNSPNSSQFEPDNSTLFKNIYINDDAEYLQWYQSYLCNSSTVGAANSFAIKVDIADSADFSGTVDTVYLVDFTKGDRARVAGTTSSNYEFYYNQMRQFIQNVSPKFINMHNNGSDPRVWNPGYTANVITKNKQYYRCSVHITWGATNHRPSVYQYYKATFETKANWKDNLNVDNGIKFMWLNRKGGIDSYTATRDTSSSIDVSQDTITKLTPYKRFPLNTTITGASMSSRVYADIYPHNREVLNVNANKNWTVFTDPITIAESRWLEEIFTSPNVWVVQSTEYSKNLKEEAGTQNVRNSDYGYIPVLITNGSATLVNEADGLVQVQIEYTDSSAINSQRN